MPFTIAHAAVAPPLSRLSLGQLPASALAVGAMAPDLEYLLFLETRRTIGHTPLGLLALCLPLSLLCLLLWHGVVKRPLGELVPDRWSYVSAALARPFPFSTWRERGLVVVAVLIGAASHVAWDAFTHADGAGVALVPQLRQPVPGLGIPVYAALQYGCGLLGLAVLAVGAVAWARRQPRVAVNLPPARDRLLAVSAILCASAAVAAANAARILAEGATAPRFVLASAVVGAMTGGAVAATVYGAARRGRFPAPG